MPFSLCLAGFRHERDAWPRGEAMSRTALRRFSAALVTLALVSLLAACEEAAEPEASTAAATTTTTSTEVVDTHALAHRAWLTQHDRTPPDRWLASRAAGVDVAPDDPAVTAMHALLMAAYERFGDKTRMIANRAVQLETALKAKGTPETAPDIIASFTKTAEAGRPLDGFGAMCQRYSILREQGMSNDDALAHLADELKAQRPAAAAPTPNKEVR